MWKSFPYCAFMDQVFVCSIPCVWIWGHFWCSAGLGALQYSLCYSQLQTADVDILPSWLCSSSLSLSAVFRLCLWCSEPVELWNICCTVKSGATPALKYSVINCLQLWDQRLSIWAGCKLSYLVCVSRELMFLLFFCCKCINHGGRLKAVYFFFKCQ